MSEFNPKLELEGIVRKITSTQTLKNQSGDKRMIIVDESSGKVVSKTRPFRRYRKYLVYADQVLKGSAEEIVIEDFSTLDSLYLQVSYKVQCSYDRAEQLIESLFFGSGEYPKRRLNALIERFIEEYIEKFDSTTEFFQKFYEYRSNLLTDLKKRVEREIGLRFSGHVSLKYEDEIKAIEVEDGFFEVFVKNYDRGMQLKYKAQLDILPNAKIKAILRFDKQGELKKIIRSQIKKEMLETIALDDFIGSFDLVKEKVTSSLNKVLEKEGRYISHLLIESENLVTDSEREFILDEYIVGCKLKDSSINITHNLILTLDDLGKYKSSTIKDLDKWVKGKLNSITKNVLFGKTYLDLILSHGEGTSKFDGDGIKDQMELEAGKIGFKVQQLISIPKVKPLELMDGFSFDVGEKAELSTINTRIKIKLIVSVSGRIMDLRKIEKYINPNIDITAKMKEKVLQSVKQVIDKIEPERYYIRFKYADQTLGDSRSVEAELIDVISKGLKKEFHASELVIPPKPLDTDITVRFAELKSQFCKFSFKTFPFREGGQGETVKFNVMYQIENVHPNGWHQFQSKKFNSIEEEIDQISTLLKEHLRNTLSTIKSEEIIYKTHIDVNKLTQIANLQLTPIISKTFGLIIKIIFMGRESTQLEDRFHERRQKVIDIHDEKIKIEKKTSIALANLKVTELDSLIERYQQLQAIPEYANSDELESVKKKIEGFSSELNDMDIGHGLVDLDEEQEGNDLDSLLVSLKSSNNLLQAGNREEEPGEED